MKLSQLMASLALIIFIIFNASAQAIAQRCPVISVSCPQEGVWTGVPIKFFARIDGPVPPAAPEFKWTLSAGSIVEGQGTTAITVDGLSLPYGPVKATLQVSGIGECSTNVSCTTEVSTCGLNEPTKFDEFGALSFEDEHARLDNFAIQLKNTAGSQGHIIAYVGQGSLLEDIESRLQRLKNYLVYNAGLEEARVVTQNGGKREEPTIELFVVPIGAVPPTPHPSVPKNR